MFAEILEKSLSSVQMLLPVTGIEQAGLCLTVLFGIGTAASSHMICNILCLIATFIMGSVLCLTNKAEFLALLLPVVYIGAVIVLFLFIIMMVDFRLKQTKEKHFKPTIKNIFKLTSITLTFASFWWLFLGGEWPTSLVVDHTNQLPYHNVLEIGKVLYTTYLVPFQWTAIILLVAMVAALWLLELHDDSSPNLNKEIKFKATNSVTYVDMPFKQGLSSI